MFENVWNFDSWLTIEVAVFWIAFVFAEKFEKYQKSGRLKKSAKDKFKQNNANRSMWILKQTEYFFHVSECLG